MQAPDVRYARSGDVSIAYEVVGAGGLDLVFAPGYVSHLTHAWRTPRLRASSSGSPRSAA